MARSFTTIPPAIPLNNFAVLGLLRSVEDPKPGASSSRRAAWSLALHLKSTVGSRSGAGGANGHRFGIGCGGAFLAKLQHLVTANTFQGPSDVYRQKRGVETPFLNPMVATPLPSLRLIQATEIGSDLEVE